jgi:hypothetical protein
MVQSPYREYQSLNHDEFKEVHTYFESKPYDFFGLRAASNEDLNLFFRYAATAGALVSTADPWGKGVGEAYIAVPVLMQNLNLDLDEDILKIASLI